jgi:ELWxxDGT repeat protein
MKKLLLITVLISNLINGQTLESFPNNQTLQVPSNFINFNNMMYYFARDSSFQYALYATDGTSANNQLIKNLGFASTVNLTDENTFNDFKIIFNNKMYFNFSNTLYQSDGTTAGTTVFNSSIQRARYFKIYNNRLYFVAYNNASGVELWSTDGTVAGTSLLKDINPGTANAFNDQLYDPHLTLFNNKLFFVANDGVHGYELWSTDGNEVGTTLFKDIRTNEGDNTAGFGAFLTGSYSYPNFKVIGSTMYFGANPNETTNALTYINPDFPILYQTDGTEAGTFFVQPPITAAQGCDCGNITYNYLYDIRGLTVIDGKLFVFGRQAFHPFGGIQNGGVYLIDGSNPISRLQGLVGNAGDVGTSDEVERYSMRLYNGEYYFLGKTYSNTDAINLWKMNPNDYTFTKVTQATNTSNPMFSNSNINLNLLVAKEINNRLFFVKTDISTGQICSTDGTVAGTQFEAKSSNENVVQTTQSTQAMSVVPLSLYSFNNALYFKAQFVLGQPTGLWRLNFSSLANSNFSNNEIQIYPNPTSDYLNINTSDNIKAVTVFDFLGKQVLTQSIFANQTQIDLIDLISGIYFVKIESENGKSEIKKIIKNNL